MTSSSSLKLKFRSSSRASTNGDRIRCDNDHFINDSPNSEESELNYLQHLGNFVEYLQASQLLTKDPYKNLSSINSQEPIDVLNITDGDGTITFSMLNMEIGRPIEFVKGKEVTCLPEDQASYVCEKVELQDVANVDTHELDKEHQKLSIEITGDEVTSYQ